MSTLMVTTPALLQRRANTATLCWYSGSSDGVSTIWAPVLFDPQLPFITSAPGFSYWYDAINGVYPDTAVVPTTCGDGIVKGKSFTSACASSKQTCVTERMYQKSGDATPMLSKVWCGGTDYIGPRTFYIERPLTKGAALSSTTVSTTISLITIPAVASSLDTASISSQLISTSMSIATIIQTPTTTPSATKDSESDAGLIVGSVVGAIGVLGIVRLLALWILRRYARQATIVTAGPSQSFSSHHHTILRRAELPQYAYSTEGRSELFGEDYRGQNM